MRQATTKGAPRIVNHAYRPKRPPRKRAKAAAITVPAIVTVPTKQERARRLDIATKAVECHQRKRRRRQTSYGG